MHAKPVNFMSTYLLDDHRREGLLVSIFTDRISRFFFLYIASTAFAEVFVYIDEPNSMSERIMPARPDGSMFLDGTPAKPCGYFHQTQDSKCTTL
jgi:hypothetical protein